MLVAVLAVVGDRLGRCVHGLLAAGERFRLALAVDLFGGTLGLGLLLLQREEALPVGHRDLEIVGMDLAEGQEAVPVAAVFDEGRLQARLHPDDPGEVDVAFELLLGSRLDVVIF